MIASMIKAIEVPDETEDKPRILIFACENDAYPALDMAGMRHANYDASVRVIPLRCLGSMNIVWIADALSRGIDGVMLMGCKFGDDYQCHFLRGSELANRRLENVKDTLEPPATGIGADAARAVGDRRVMSKLTQDDRRLRGRGSASSGRIRTRDFNHGRQRHTAVTIRPD